MDNTKRQTLPTIPQEPKRSWWKFWFLTGLFIGTCLGSYSKAQASYKKPQVAKTIYEQLTEQDKDQLDSLIKGLKL